VPVDEVADKFLELIHELEDVSRTLSAQQALADFDETTLQVFWRKWPNVAEWAGSLWSMLCTELSVPSSPQMHPDAAETGGSG
jgi:hypothetical protein